MCPGTGDPVGAESDCRERVGIIFMLPLRGCGSASKLRSSLLKKSAGSCLDWPSCNVGPGESLGVLGELNKLRSWS